MNALKEKSKISSIMGFHFYAFHEGVFWIMFELILLMDFKFFILSTERRVLCREDN